MPTQGTHGGWPSYAAYAAAAWATVALSWANQALSFAIAAVTLAIGVVKLLNVLDERRARKRGPA